MSENNKTEVMRFRVTPTELGHIKQVAERLERNTSDSIRFLLRKSYRDYIGDTTGTSEKDEENAAALV